MVRFKQTSTAGSGEYRCLRWSGCDRNQTALNPIEQTERTNRTNKPNEQTERTSRTNTSHDSSPNLRPLELENQHLRREGEAALQRALSAENRLQSALNSISELTEQIDHLTQLLAMSQKTIQQMTDQNQLLLEDTRKKAPWWRRIFANGTSGSPPLHSDSDVDNQS